MSEPGGGPEPAEESGAPRYAAPPDAPGAGPDEPARPPRYAQPAHGARARVDQGPLWRQWPLLLALALFVVGVVVAAAGHWRRGSLLMGAAAAVAGLLRLLLPAERAGLLVVRRRWFDVLVLLVTGAGMGVLSVLVPPQQ